jgi:glycosyltransferase involved in cell wall biosynthesis
MRVLFNSPNPNLQGGPPTHLPLLEHELRKYVDMELFHYGRQTDSETIMDKCFGRIRDLWLLHLQIRSFHPHVLHHNSAFDPRSILRDMPLVFLARYHRVPILIKVHGSHREAFGRLNPVLTLLRRFLLKNVSLLGVLSEAEKGEFVQTWPELKERLAVVKNIIKSEFFHVVRSESVFPSVLFLSRFVRNKGMFDLLEAIPEILLDMPEAKFTFIGSGPDAAEFCDEVIKRNLEKSVTWVEHIVNDESVRYYSFAWALVFPTRFPEGMPMVVAEAMAGGVPVVTTKTRFSNSYMLEGVHCLYIHPQTPGGIANKVVSILRDPDLRERMSNSNRELAHFFTAEQVSREFLALYKRITNFEYNKWRCW